VLTSSISADPYITKQQRSVAETGGTSRGLAPLTPLIYSLIYMNSADFANFALTGPPQLANLGNPASAVDKGEMNGCAVWKYCTRSCARTIN
jgi:hypothetical protein